MLAIEMVSKHYHAHDDFHIKHPFAIVFRYVGTVWPLVLPYCLFNTFVLIGLTILKNHTEISLSILPTGHALMSILIAYLGVSKVNLAYERYMSAQIATGHAFMILRELNQLSITLTEQYTDVEANEWREVTKQTIVQLIHETVATLRDERHAAALVRNFGYRSGIGIDKSKTIQGTGVSVAVNTSGVDDPMGLVHALRSHLYNASTAIGTKKAAGRNGNGVISMEEQQLNLFERCKLIDLLHEFTQIYRNLLRLASSPLPFVLVQMGRTFVFVYTLSIPFVLMGEKFEDYFTSALGFVIVLTYGFLGLEFVSRILANPFGDETKNDFNIRGMGSAAIVGIEEDSEQQQQNLHDRRTNPMLKTMVQRRQESIKMSTRYIVLDGSKDWSSESTKGNDNNGFGTSATTATPYYTMEEDDGELHTSSVFL